MPFDPDVFGGGSGAPGFDPDVFGTPSQKKLLTREQIAAQIANDPISQGARSFAGQGSDALGGVSQAALNLLAGGVRGAGSIGATIAAPVDYAMDALKGDRGKNLSYLVTGNELPSRNTERRQQLDANLQSVGAQPDSLFYKGGKLGGEIAGTAGIGGAIAAPLRAAAPSLAPLASAIESGGFRTGAALPVLQNAGARILGGAISGGAQAGLVDPKDAGLGAVIGGAIPGVVMGAGKAGEAIGSLFPKGPQANARTLDTARQSIDAGYVIPPNMVNPSLKNQIIESISGKQATQQIASTKNTQVTEGLVKQALGIPEGAQLTQSTLENLRKTAGKAYADVSSLSPQAAADLEALKQARNDASAWFKSYNRSASPADLAKAKEFRATADNLENLLEFHALQAGREDLVPALKEARKQIAKTYTVGRALNDASGTVDARVLGRMYEKGLPLSDGLDVAGQFASAFPTIAKSPQQVGSPAAHNLKAGLSAAFGGGGAGAGALFGMGAAGMSGLGAIGAALPFITPPIARSIMFRKAAQQGLLNVGEPEALGLLTGASRALPVAVPSLLGP